MRKTLVSGLVLFVCFCAFLLIPNPSEPAKTTPGKSPQTEFAGMSVCEGCHEAVAKRLEATANGVHFIRHSATTPKELVCETCHGPAKDHADSGGEDKTKLVRFTKKSITQADRRNQACLQCHEKRHLLFWQGSVHDTRDAACSDCHKIHSNPPEKVGRYLLAAGTEMDTCKTCHSRQVGEQMRFSHHPLREGKMNCSSCHNPHGTPTDKLLNANSLNELCYTCHPKYRGPVIFQHPPVTENCANCHNVHGTAQPRLLKQPQIRLCRECHVTFHTANFGNNARLTHVMGRPCTACHVNIHGSNHPGALGSRAQTFRR